MKKTKDIKVSIIVAIYNVAPFLCKLLDSIISQTYENIEIILVNDGSTDESKDICDTYAFIDSRIKCFHQENKGGCAARNLGLKMMTGAYFTIIDGDDWVEPDYVEYLLNLAILNNAEMSLTDSVFTTRDEEQSIEECIEVWNKERAASTIIWRKWPMGSWNKLYKTEMVRRNNLSFSVPWWGEGMYFATMAAQYANICAKGHKRIYHYRQNNPNSAVTKYNVQAGINSLWNIKNIKKQAIITNDVFFNAIHWHTWYNYNYLLRLIIGTNGYIQYWREVIECLLMIRIMLPKLLLMNEITLEEKKSMIKYAIAPIYKAKKDIIFREKQLLKDIANNI